MTGRSRLVVTSLLADNADPLFSELADYLAGELGVDAAFWAGAWDARRRRALEGEAVLVSLCGALYLFDRELGERLELLAAPVSAGEAAAVYYTDVVVGRAHPARGFAELRGCAWAYNEPASHSGYHAVRAHLAAIGEPRGFFGRVVEAGSHQAALDLVLRGEADAAPIDSYVLACELLRRPRVADAVRTIARIGPSPAPPVAISASAPAELRLRVRAALVAMHERDEGTRRLRAHLVDRFAPVSGAYYEPLRGIAAAGEGVSLT